MRRTTTYDPTTARGRGFFIFEMIVGLGLLSLAAFVLILSTSRVHRASATMADGRQATRAAEAALSQLQAGRTTTSPDPDAQVRIDPVSAPNDGAWRWVEVTATVRGQRRVLVGRVPAKAPQSAPAQGGRP